MVLLPAQPGHGPRRGAKSFRGDVVKENFDPRPGKSEHNPTGLPEATITEFKLKEFGPTPFPAYSGATAVLRSLTDEIVVEGVVRAPEVLRTLLENTGAAALLEEKPGEPTSSGSEPPHSDGNDNLEGEEVPWWHLR